MVFNDVKKAYSSTLDSLHADACCAFPVSIMGILVGLTDKYREQDQKIEKTGESTKEREEFPWNTENRHRHSVHQFKLLKISLNRD